MADVLAKPDKGEDVRLLWRYVAVLVKRINALLNMTGDFESSLFHGHGGLRVLDNYAEMRIATGGADVEDSIVNKKQTDVVIASSQSPADYGVSIHFIAAVAIDATGTIQFYIDNGGFGSPVTISGGLAISVNISNLSSGDHEIKAHYSGDSKYLDAWGTFTQHINSLNPPVIQVVATPNPAEKGIDYVTLIAAVVGQNPIPPAPNITGVVRFFIDGSAFGSDRPLHFYSGNEWRADTSDNPINYLDAGDHLIQAVYMGDRNYGTAGDSYILHVKMGSTCIISADQEYVQPNDNFTVYATVSPFAGQFPTGTVTFYKDGAAQGTFSLNSNGQAAMGVNAGPTQGDFTWSFSYSGDSFFMPGSSNDLVIHVQVESPMPANLGFTPSEPVINGSAGVFTLEATNADLTHNAFSGPMDVAFYSAGWGSGHICLASVNGGNFTAITTNPAFTAILLTDALFVGGYLDNVQIAVTGNDPNNVDGCTVSVIGIRRNERTGRDPFNYAMFNVSP